MERMDKARAVDLVIVGSVGIDAIATPLETRADVLGGAGSYACAAASFFARTGMVGVVGSDFPAKEHARLKAFGIDLEGLQRVPGATFRWSGVYEDDFVNRRTLSTELGVFAEFRPDLPARYRAARHLLLGNIGPELQLRVLDQAERAEFVAVDTMDLWIRIAQDALREVIRRVKLLTLNDCEARMLTGAHNLRDCAETLLAMGPQYVVIKKGEHGALLFSKDGIVILPAYPVRQVIDPTGAGDTFAGACMGYLASRGAVGVEDIVRGLRYGGVVASFGVEAFGLDALETLTLARIEARLAELRAMVR
jgi:sugar/nucleoside kinase (ribokinase family)